tara:strand:- start:8190 stop:8972 length:783 start_codon:yes stop_codon:yes gene_type:complete
MNIKFHRVILTTDENPDTLEIWPFISSAWNTWFPEVSIELAFVTDKDFSDPYVKHMTQFGNIHLFRKPKKQEVPLHKIVNACKVLLPSMIGDGSICLVTTMDSFPLNREFYKNATDPVKQDRVLILGENEFVVNSDYLRKIVNPENKTSGELLSSWDKWLDNFNCQQFFTDHRNRGAKIDVSLADKGNFIDMRKSGSIEMSKMWSYHYDKCIIPQIPFSQIQPNLKLLIDFIGTNEVKFDNVDKNPKPHWIGVKEPATKQ